MSPFTHMCTARAGHDVLASFRLRPVARRPYLLFSFLVKKIAHVCVSGMFLCVLTWMCMRAERVSDPPEFQAVSCLMWVLEAIIQSSVRVNNPN